MIVYANTLQGPDQSFAIVQVQKETPQFPAYCAMRAQVWQIVESENLAETQDNLASPSWGVFVAQLSDLSDDLRSVLSRPIFATTRKARLRREWDIWKAGMSYPAIAEKGSAPP